jgi:xanthine dehydrogenase accessory factor
VQSIVVREALKTIQERKPRLIRIAPDLHPKSEYGVTSYPMTCQSGGTLELYIEPVLPAPQVLIFGRTAVAQSLCKLGRAIGYSVSVVAPGSDASLFRDADRLLEMRELGDRDFSEETFIVVSTQGENDEEALECALRTNVQHVAFVASAVKARKVLQSLVIRGIPAGVLERVKAPAGLDIRAQEAGEIAVSILAEIILKRRDRELRHRNDPASGPARNTEETDPVCGMIVSPDNSSHFSVYEGRTYYFCCAGCKQEFDAQPAAHAAARA